MKSKYLETMISFSIGVSWALSFALGAYLFTVGLSFGLVTAVLLFFIGFCSGFLFIGFFEGLSMLQDITVEKKEQTKLLKEILDTLTASKESADEKIPNN